MRRRIWLILVVAALAATTLLLGGVFGASSAGRPSALPPARAVESLQTGFSAGNTAVLVANLQSTLQRAPDDSRSLVLLGLAYQQRARETGDPSYYTKSEGVLRRARELDGRNYLVYSGLGSLALSRHRFREALVFGRRAHALSPTTARNFGVIGDALAELGRYGEAFAAFDRLATLKPGLAAYARVSYARELRGDHRGAVTAMQLAVDAALGSREATAWSYTQLGKLYWNRGLLAKAGAAYRAALAFFPGYASALDALAQVEAARGHLRRAIALERRAVDQVPTPQYVAALGDLYRGAGKPKLARDQDALVGVIDRLFRANGVETDLEIALFNADRAVRLRETLARARAAHAARRSIDADDVLAWALYRNRRCAEARAYSRRALRLGTEDALKFFHRGMIERCLGHASEARMWLARAYELNPHFSVRWAPTLERAVR